MPHAVAHAVNTNDIMQALHDAHMLASQPPLST